MRLLRILPPRATLIYICVLLLFVAPAPAYSQATDAPQAEKVESPLPTYDVMTIKLNKSGSGSVSVHSGGDRFSASNVSLKNLLQGIYDIKEDLISGLPESVDSARFDIEAKISDPDRAALKKMSAEQERRMLIPLLAERFQLKTHIETKVLPVYELIVIKGEPKFKPSADQSKRDNGSTNINCSRNHCKLSAHDIPMTSLARSIGGQVHRTVIDKSGLAGNYDLVLEWATEDSTDTQTDSYPAIFTAIQEQLGLKLQPSKGPVETLVVDHVEMPSDN